MIPELDLTRIRRWVESRNSELPDRAQELIRYELDVTDRTVTIIECRPPWAAGLWAGVDPVPSGPASVHQDERGVVALLARSQPEVSRVRPRATYSPRRGSHRRDRARPDLHLLGAETRWSQVWS